MQAGNAVSWFGYGLILPFEIIYVHQIRGFGDGAGWTRRGGAHRRRGTRIPGGRPRSQIPDSHCSEPRHHHRPLCAVRERPAAVCESAYTLGPGAIGIVFLVNTSFIVIAQLPATRVVKRMRRAQAFAAASTFFAIALVGVLPATLIHSELWAAALLCGVATVFAMGECVHGVVLGPVVADLAPPHLLGRYISLYTLMPTAGLAIGPAIGGAVLATSPDAVWWGAPSSPQ